MAEAAAAGVQGPEGAHRQLQLAGGVRPRLGFFALVRLLLAQDGQELIIQLGAEHPTLDWVTHALFLQ
eukprot:10764626-Heterocapsa_arctica.AAC.1